jgi:hypothetical protein
LWVPDPRHPSFASGLESAFEAARDYPAGHRAVPLEECIVLTEQYHELLASAKGYRLADGTAAG